MLCFFFFRKKRAIDYYELKLNKKKKKNINIY